MPDHWRNIDDFLRSKRIRFGAPTSGQTTGGAHAPGSNHYRGLARDYGDAASDVRAVAAALTPYAKGKHYILSELFFTPTGTFFKNGSAITPTAGLRHSHRDHVHAALRPGARLPVPHKFSDDLTDDAPANDPGDVDPHSAPDKHVMSEADPAGADATPQPRTRAGVE